MHRNYFNIILALTTISLVLILAFFLQKTPKEHQENLQPMPSPFKSHITGVGIVEPKSGNIFIGTPFNRIVGQINVSVNDHVKKGDILFQLDHQDLSASLQVKQREYEKALANFKKLQSLPQKEDLSIAEEALKRAQAAFNESKSQYEMVSNLPSARAISKEEQDKRLYKYRMAEAELKERQSQLQKIQSGTWQPDLDIAFYEVAQAQAGVAAIETEIQRTFIKSPLDGTVLQIKVHEGETPSSDPSNTLMILGNTDELYLRVSIDQFDVPFINPKVKAVAYRQGDDADEFPLEFILVEPYMVPKKYLTNAAAEKVDTQVLEILYRITKKEPRLFIGEQLDVFLEKK